MWFTRCAIGAGGRSGLDDTMDAPSAHKGSTRQEDPTGHQSAVGQIQLLKAPRPLSGFSSLSQLPQNRGKVLALALQISEA